MDHFSAQAGVLCAEQVSCEELAARHGTPTYVYARATLERHVQVLREALDPLPHLLCYAVKANSNLAILESLATLGCSFDAVSLGELVRLQQVGVPAKDTIFSGVGKRDDEIAAALTAGVLYICIESASELAAVARIAQSMGITASVAMRVNPDVDAQTHPHIATALRESKFGLAIDDATALASTIAKSRHVRLRGVTCHIGSQITTLPPFVRAAEHMRALVERMRAEGHALDFVGMGGGLGIPYLNETPPAPAEYARAIKAELGALGLTLVLEPGRVIVGNAGILLTRVTRIKEQHGRRFVIVDAGMNDLARPAIYGAKHDIVAVSPRAGEPVAVDIVGPVCESSDKFATARYLPPLQEGDLLAIRSAGAYGFVMSSNYNARPRAAEVLVDKSHATVVRERESLSDLWRGEFRLGKQT